MYKLSLKYTMYQIILWAHKEIMIMPEKFTHKQIR